MPAFLVDPNVVADASLRLGSVPRGVEDIHGQLGRHLGAAAGTPAAGAIDDLLSRFSHVLPQFALASAHLSRAVASAARDYRASDAAVAEACKPGGATVTVGFLVPEGEPAQLTDAARWHEAAADEFDGHAALIDHTAGSLAHVWQGEAASGYQTLSDTLAAHFRIAADSSRSASTILLRYAHALDGYQQQARRCLAEAEHWQGQVETDRAKLARAEQALYAAQTAVAQARHDMHATANLADAQTKLVEAEATVRDAKRALCHAEDELEHWQARGRQVCQEAHDAGNQASQSLETLTVPSPPSAPASAAPAPSTLATAAPIPAAAAVTALIATGNPIGGSAALPSGAGATTGGPNLPAVTGGAAQGALTFGDLEEIGRRFGWSHAELQAWWQVISDESGGNPGAVNPTSGAFGIGQFLGATYKEYLPFGSGSPNPLNQLNAMAQYIHDRYGSPLAALAHECSCHWY